jgi:hypothetical protein
MSEINSSNFGLVSEYRHTKIDTHIAVGRLGLVVVGSSRSMSMSISMSVRYHLEKTKGVSSGVQIYARLGGGFGAPGFFTPVVS